MKEVPRFVPNPFKWDVSGQSPDIALCSWNVWQYFASLYFTNLILHNILCHKCMLHSILQISCIGANYIYDSDIPCKVWVECLRPSCTYTSNIWICNNVALFVSQPSQLTDSSPSLCLCTCCHHAHPLPRWKALLLNGIQLKVGHLRPGRRLLVSKTVPWLTHWSRVLTSSGESVQRTISYCSSVYQVQLPRVWAYDWI